MRIQTGEFHYIQKTIQKKNVISDIINTADIKCISISKTNGEQFSHDLNSRVQNLAQNFNARGARAINLSNPKYLTTYAEY